MGGWGISPYASPKEKIKAEMADELNGLNCIGGINYTTYSQLYDFSMKLLDEMYDLGKKEEGKE